MANNMDIDTYVNDPALLVQLCKKVVDQISDDARNDEMAAMEIQLREISRTISALEKQNVSVPDALTSEQGRLFSALSLCEEAKKTLQQLESNLIGLFPKYKAPLVKSPAQKEEPAPQPQPEDSNRFGIPKLNKKAIQQFIVDAKKVTRVPDEEEY